LAFLSCGLCCVRLQAREDLDGRNDDPQAGEREGTGGEADTPSADGFGVGRDVGERVGGLPAWGNRSTDALIDFYLYGVTRFGRQQAERYERELRHAISLAAENTRMATERAACRPPVRIHDHGKHYIVYLIRDDHALIVRVLRDGVNLRRHL
jgi:toxin ParE1/3/4